MAFTATILLLGAGELGREFVISAKRLGARVVACDAYDDAPAMQVADGREVFSMLDGAALRALQFAYAFEGRGGAGAAGSGAMLSVGWRDGQMSLVPLVF